MTSGFVNRHVGTDATDQRRMLAAVDPGLASLDALVERAVPGAVLNADDGLLESALPAPADERETLAELAALAAANRVRRSFLGMGYHGTITPAAIRRGILEAPGWYPAYTPYQPENSQGRLEALLNFQTMVADLTGLATANASMLDEGTAVVEGMLLARRAARPAEQTDVFLVDADALPQTRALVAHRAEALGIEVVELPLADVAPEDLPPAFGVLIQHPGASGRLWDPSVVADAVHARGGLVVAAADLLALTLVRAPGELGADVAVGTTQRFGVPLGYGGPHAGYMAVRTGLERQLPGRLVGVSKDAGGDPAYRLSLQTREQHIRREKATSNICTAQVLLAVVASMYAVHHGPDGLARIACAVHDRTVRLARALGDAVVHRDVVDTLAVRLPGRAAQAVAAAAERDLLLWLVDDDTLQVTLDETTTDAEVELLAEILAAHGAAPSAEGTPDVGIPAALRRTSDYLTHPVFRTHRSETSLVRYMRALEDKDYALDRGMIPLGSCTMKLNSAVEMTPVTWPAFADLHPFAPPQDAAGTLALVADLERWLADLTGYAAVSLQPNAGSQGELAGLLAVREYHRSRGDAARTVCLIPSSAHGTNAASAVLAGLRVVVVACDETGSIDLDDLRAKVAEHADDLAAIMVTYPSTHGVYEDTITEVRDVVHAAGGQVYVDGANLNALLGHVRLGDLGDVSHLNLHKTFCIPHGGGGPGVGPVAVREHLAPFLPGHPLDPRAAALANDDGPAHRRIVSAAPLGSPLVLPITWAYLLMMGADGLRHATASAVLGANYLAARLRDHFPVLYTGEGGLVAHECILDLRPLRAATGITVDDVAKRLVDYGFHAPTVSFPVAGTLMVEPTESEDLAELDRFVDAMVAIRAEADAVAEGRWPADDNPLVHAPHTAASVVEEWTHPYSRDLAVFPAQGQRGRKYWPPVRRIDQAYGDRNLVCACPPPEAFA